MISIIINMLTTLIILITLILTYKTGERPNQNRILGVTLPYSELENEAVVKIVKKYHASCNKIGITFFLLMLPLIILSAYISISILYILGWCCLIFYCYIRTQRKYFHQLYTLKREKEWYTGEKHIICIDTEVSRLKDTMPVSKIWFWAPFFLSVLPMVLLILQKEALMKYWLFAICSIICVSFSFLAFLQVTKERTVVYSDDTKINIALNQVYKHRWSKCWVEQAYNASIVITLLFLLICYKEVNLVIILVVIGVSTCLSSASIYAAYHHIRQKRQQLLTFQRNENDVDDDIYWESGTYNNPNDKRIWVEKRIGMGTTLNMGTIFGTLANVFLAIIILGAIALSIYLSPLDFGKVDLLVKDGTAYIDAPMMSDEFAMSDVQKVEQINTLPKMSKQKGGDSDHFYIGRFQVQGYGQCTVYVHRNSPSYLVVTLSDRILLLNGETPKETEAYYSMLTK